MIWVDYMWDNPPECDQRYIVAYSNTNDPTYISYDICYYCESPFDKYFNGSYAEISMDKVLGYMKVPEYTAP